MRTCAEAAGSGSRRRRRSSTPGSRRWRRASSAASNAFVRLTPEELHQRIDQPTHLGGVWEPGMATVQPALLARGLRRVALGGCADLRGLSDVAVAAATALPGCRTRSGRVTPPTRSCSRSTPGRLRCRSCGARCFPSRATSSPPGRLPDLLEQIRWTGGEAIADGRLLVHYYQATPDGRIVFGKGGGSAGLRRANRRRIPTDDAGRLGVAGFARGSGRRQLRGSRSPHAWSGPVECFARRPAAFGRRWGRAHHFGAGLFGKRRGPSRWGATSWPPWPWRRDDEWSGCGLVRRPPDAFPPEPVRYLGGLAVRGAVSRKEAAEDAGARPGAATRLLAGSPPPASTAAAGATRPRTLQAERRRLTDSLSLLWMQRCGPRRS